MDSLLIQLSEGPVEKSDHHYLHYWALGVYQNIDTTIYRDISYRGTLSIYWCQISIFNDI